jgi:hypothetical protein
MEIRKHKIFKKKSGGSLLQVLEMKPLGYN